MKNCMLCIMVLLQVALGSGSSVAGDEAGQHEQLIADASRGDREAQYTLAHLLIKGQSGLARDSKAAVAWFERAAGSGHRDAAFDLAQFYLEGTWLPKDNQRALLWLEKAAELGQVDAQYWLGLIYRKRFPEQAVVWLKKASGAGHAEAARELAALCKGNRKICR